MVDSGVPFPGWERRPTLQANLVWVMQAFHELGTCRTSFGMTVGAIPWTAINSWVLVQEIADAERFTRLIRALDAAFLESIHSKRDKKAT
jgi:hypothetical protein